MTENKGARAVVVGGGIVGLTVGVALHQRGWNVIVCESADELRGGGAAIGNWSPAIATFDLLGVGREIRENSGVNTQAFVRDPSGRLLKEEELTRALRDGYSPYMMTDRILLTSLLADRLGRERLQFSRAFTSYEHRPEGVVVNFADGTSQEVDLLVGADGTFSTVRSQAFPEAVPVRRQVAFRAVVKVEDLPDGHPGSSTMVVGRDGVRGGWMESGPGTVMWVIVRQDTEEPDPEGDKQECLSLVPHLYDPGWHFPLRELVEGTDPSAILRNYVHVYEAGSRWVDRRVVLAGDAAHTMTPTLGVGGAVGVEDAWVLAELLAGHDIDTALTHYAHERTERLAWLSEVDRKISAWKRPEDYSELLVGFITEMEESSPPVKAARVAHLG